jgi:hypothetical protein
MPGNAGFDAKNVLLTILGEHYIQIDELVQMLVRKGVMTEQEWDDVMTARLSDEKRPPSWWVAQFPADRAAVDEFFGPYDPEA